MTAILFDLAGDSNLRFCNIVKIKIGEIVSGGRITMRAIFVQQKTGRPAQFELLEPAITPFWLDWLDWLAAVRRYQDLCSAISSWRYLIKARAAAGK